MKINQAGIDLIKSFEGLYLNSYYCPSGVLTIGYGTTGSRVHKGMTITQEDAERFLAEDLVEFEQVVSQVVKVSLNENQFSALVSFAYNCGAEALRTSTALKRLNAGDYAGCCEALQWWTKATGGQVLPGLVRRRKAEVDLFNTPVQEQPTEVIPLKLAPRSSVVEPTDELKGGKCDIKIWLDTHFVQSPAIAPELLPEDQKIFLPAGTMLPVLAWRAVANNFLVVTLDNVVLKGRNTWHCSLNDVKMRLPKQGVEAPSAPRAVQHAVSRPIVPGDLSTLPGGKVLRFMQDRGFRVKALNLVYIVGASADDWSPIPNTVDEWNDVRCIIRDSGEVLGSWKATTDPGRYYLSHPLNEAGCAILALGQHKDGWQLGLHRGYPALTQCGDIIIYRDRTQSGVRSGHTMVAGAECGINHHGTSGHDGDPRSIGRWSAGCCVGMYWKSHLQFVQFCRDSGSSTFDATLLDGQALQQFN